MSTQTTLLMRQVSAEQTVNIDGNTYHCPKWIAGSKVAVAVAPVSVTDPTLRPVSAAIVRVERRAEDGGRNPRTIPAFALDLARTDLDTATQAYKDDDYIAALAAATTLAIHARSLVDFLECLAKDHAVNPQTPSTSTPPNKTDSAYLPVTSINAARTKRVTAQASRLKARQRDVIQAAGGLQNIPGARESCSDDSAATEPAPCSDQPVTDRGGRSSHDKGMI